MKWLLKILTISLCLLLPSVALAIDLGDSVQIHGFISQGYLHGSDNNFLAESQSGSFEFTDLGLNLNWAMLDNVRVGGQLFYRNLGDYSEDKATVDWALLDYRAFDWLGVRLGKVKMPFGLYNENRDSDFLQPMIFLPQSIYDESRRDTNLAYIGGGIYGNIAVSSWGDIDYHFFTGDNTYPTDSILAQSNETKLQGNIKKNNGYKNSPKPAVQALYNPLIPSSFESAERKSEELHGGSLIFNSALTSLRLGFSLLQSENAIYVNGAAVPLTVAKVNSKVVLSLEYAWDDWLFVTEYGETDRQTKSAGVVTMDSTSQAWYLMISYAPFERWAFSVLYDEFYRDKDDKDGETSGDVAYTAWRKDIGVTARYDFNDNWNLKVEYHNIDGAAMQLKVTNPDGVERFWNYFAAKLSYSF